MKPTLMFILLIFIILTILSCSLFSGKYNIPDDAIYGLKDNSMKILGHLQLSDWAGNVTDKKYFTVFSGELISTGNTELRVFYNDGAQTIYIGVLSDQLGTPMIKTTFIDLGQDRCIIGWVSPEITGKLLYIRFGHFEPDMDRWLSAQKESSIERNIFILPIKSEDVSQWNLLSDVTVQTQETLDRGYDGLGSYYALEKHFAPPLDISNYYNNISIQP